MTERCLTGLIGANIGRSLSPALHDDCFAAAGIAGHYHLMDLNRLGDRTDLAGLLRAVRATGFAGVNVTHPCKEAILPLLDAVDPVARAIGAVNTVAIDAAGRTTGYNTDWIGFQRSFAERFGIERARLSRAVIVGAGGAGRAVAFALLDAGADKLVLYDTAGERAEALAASLAAHFGAGRADVAHDLAVALAGAPGVVNCTPIGMHSYPGSSVPPALLRTDLWVADVVYTPLETALIRAARAAGCGVLTGGGMCIHQAAEAFFLFTGRRPDITRMRALFERLAAASA